MSIIANIAKVAALYSDGMECDANADPIKARILDIIKSRDSRYAHGLQTSAPYTGVSRAWDEDTAVLHDICSEYDRCCFCGDAWISCGCVPF